MLSLAVFVLAPAIAAPPEPENLYRAAKLGDWVEYTIAGPQKVVSRQTVVAKTADKLTLKIEQSVDGKAGEASESVIDLKGPYPPLQPKPLYTRGVGGYYLRRTYRDLGEEPGSSSSTTEGEARPTRHRSGTFACTKGTTDRVR